MLPLRGVLASNFNLTYHKQLLVCSLNASKFLEEKMFELIGVDEKAQESFKDINACLSELSAMRLGEVGPREADLIVPKVVWKVRCYAQGIIYRVVELTEATCSTWNNENLLASILLSRSVLETAATVFDFTHRVEKALDSKDFSTINNLVMSHTFSGSYFEDDEKLERLPKICTLIDRMDRRLFKDTKKKPVRSTYNILSEYSHPNWSGTVGFYGELHPQEFKQYFSAARKDVKGISANVVAGVGCIRIVQKCLDDIEGCVPKIWKLSENHRHEQGR